MESVLELRDLTKHYPTHQAVNCISLCIKPGEFFSLVGPSGCGKTTTLRLIAGFEAPTSGEILLNGNSVTSLPPYRRDVNTVFQSYALFPHLTVVQNVAFGLERRRRESKIEIREKVKRALALVQLSGKESRLPSQISGGERQRVALARSLVLEPQVLLLDEPLSALDPKLRKQMRGELKSLQRRVGIAFLFVTHDQEEALSLSDRMAVMNGGRLEQIGAPRELYQQPKSRFAAEFLGEVNWINGTGVRPEATRISSNSPGDSVSSFTAVVEGSTFLGDCVHVQTRLPDGAQCTAELRRQECPFRTGDPVYVWWHASDELHFPIND
ncbi:MAG: ABC transporter ATP-binding protein [Acidobacteriaceae bacterium]|nr:ABC transporter ATP-binding protein [Acidobacteriaceae bacterium]MBV9297017.1 ABC transporter ATP-binding protein [Acidobacteriaceae bacterium]MBV9767882.1 ABC transporter ATP-binding protein [Acidobacteriaceae bacterium]